MTYLSRDELPEWSDDKLLGRNSEVFLKLTHLITTFQRRACPTRCVVLASFLFCICFLLSCCQRVVNEEGEDDEDNVEEDDETDQEYDA